MPRQSTPSKTPVFDLATPFLTHNHMSHSVQCALSAQGLRHGEDVNWRRLYPIGCYIGWIRYISIGLYNQS